MAQLILSNGGKAIISNEDIPKVSSHRWYLSKNGYVVSTTYVRGSGRAGQKNVHLYLHRLITNAPKGRVVDHLNRNPLDNRRCNLRVCNQTKNLYNSKQLSSNTSGAKGVAWHKGAQKWEAFINYMGKKIYLGVFKSKTDAIHKRNEAFNYYLTI